MVRAGLLSIVFVVACATRGPTRPVEPPAVVRAEAPEPVVSVVAPSLTIRFVPQVTEAPPRLVMELTARGIGARRWALAAGEPGELQVRDAAGDLAFVQGRKGQAWTVELARAPVGALTIGYSLVPGGESGDPELPAGLALRVDRQRVLAAAEEVLLLPQEDPGAIGVELELLATGPAILRVASTLGAPGWRGTVRLGELQHAAFLLGPLGHAEFRGPEGDDDFAWAGDTSFDLRWSAAETAGARTAVDAYFHAGATRRFVGVLAVDVDFAGSGGISVFPRGEGLYVAIAPGALWDARARLAVAHGLVHRWIGGRLRLRGAAGEGRELGAWFSAGFARAVAREVIYDLGTLSGRDYADEVNVHEAVLATAPLRRANNAVVAAAAAGGDMEAEALLLARGVLYATGLAARLRGRGSLRGVLGEMIAQAQEAGVAELPIEAFTRRVAALLGAQELAIFTASVLDGEVVRLPADALGPCYVRKPRMYTRFDLGFDERATLAGTPATIRGLRAGGPAARAGLKEGETLLSLGIDPEDATGPATVTVLRGDREVQVTYRPVSAPAPGDGWSRRVGAPERECPP